MITPRRTRLVRVSDPHTFRRALINLSLEGGPLRLRSRLVVVPTRGAARQLGRLLAGAGCLEPPALVTRDEMYDALYRRLPGLPRRLTVYERDVIMQAAARDASTARDVARPGVVAEMIRFYDQLRRHGRHVGRFEELIEETLASDAEVDRGAARMLAQTRWLAASFRGYEERVAKAGACDEHGVRERILSVPSPDPIRDLVVSVGDWIADPNGFNLADFDLLTRVPGAETVDIVATERTLSAGFHQRVHDWLPGLAEIDARALGLPAAPLPPALVVPGEDGDPLVFTVRDREEELIAIARGIKAERPNGSLDRVAVVFKRPLPYLYLAPEVFGAAGLPYEASDTLPLAAEPFAAALDLVLQFVESGFARPALVALLRSPHFSFEGYQDLDRKGTPLARDQVSVLDRALSEARYLGGLDRLGELAAAWNSEAAPQGPAAEAARLAAEQLSPLLVPAAASVQLRHVLSFLGDHASHASAGDPVDSRPARARQAVCGAIDAFASAHAAHDDAPMAIGGLTRAIRRWIEEQTFESGAPGARRAGLQLVDDQAARYGDFETIAVVGLVQDEWPERPPRNIFYPASLLTALGWPPEKDRHAAAEARFLDLVTSASQQVSLWTITLDDDALVQPATLLDDVARAGLATTTTTSTTSSSSRKAVPTSRVFPDDALSADPVDLDALELPARDWAEMRASRTPAVDPVFHGSIGEPPPAARSGWSVSALETYLGCPFKFFAQHVLKLKEEPEDEEVMDPRTQGEFMHEVFRAFFEGWRARGYQAITPANLETARAVFAEVADEHLGKLSETEAALERTRLMGSPAAAGLAEAVLRMEAERPVAVVDRRLEFDLKGEFVFDGPAGPRTITLRGKADRVDLLADGTFRVIDYKLGWPPNKARALQLPIYGLCAEQRLHAESGRRWTLGEAAYLAFKGPRRVVPLFGAAQERGDVLEQAQQLLIATVDAIDRGEFPPRPDDVHRCETCSYDAVCRKDYVGDV